MNDIKSIVAKIASLKPIPQVVHRVLAIAEDPAGDQAELAAVIAHDPILTANLLKNANSAYYGRPGKFETVQQAVVFLGSAEVVDLVLMASSGAHLNKAQQGYDLEEGQLWRYSLSSAFLAKAVAAMKGIEKKQLVFTASLLKDIGKLILSRYVSEQFQEIGALVANHEHSFRQAEKAVLGIDHAELGAMVAQVWQFSPQMIDLIKNHHQPLMSELALKESAAVYMGDILCMMIGAGVGADGLAYRFQRQVVDLLQITEKEIQLILVDFGEKMDRLEAFLSA